MIDHVWKVFDYDDRWPTLTNFSEQINWYECERCGVGHSVFKHGPYTPISTIDRNDNILRKVLEK